MDVQLVIVALAAACAALYAGRAVWRQLQCPDDEPPSCQGCPAKRVRGVSGLSQSEGGSTGSEGSGPLCLLAPPLLLGLLFQSPPARTYDVNEWLSVGGVLSGGGQCQLLRREAGASDACRGGLPVQPEMGLHPTESDEFFVKLGFAAGDGLNGDSPFALASWAADLQADVEHIHGRWSYLLNAWHRHRFELREDIVLSVTGGIIDATDYLDNNAYSNDEYTQFMNQALVNGPNTFLPSYDVGGALQLDLGSWSVRGVAMQVGENDAGRSFGFFGGQLGYRAETRWGEGNYRVLVVGTTRDFLDPTASREESCVAVGLSFDQQLGQTVGAYLRIAWQDDRAAITYHAIYSGGIDLAGDLWGRPQDNIGLAYGCLPGGNGNVLRTQVAELYYRFAAWEYLAITADLQYMQDDLRIGKSPRGLIMGLRFTSQF